MARWNSRPRWRGDDERHELWAEIWAEDEGWQAGEFAAGELLKLSTAVTCQHTRGYVLGDQNETTRMGEWMVSAPFCPLVLPKTAVLFAVAWIRLTVIMNDDVSNPENNLLGGLTIMEEEADLRSTSRCTPSTPRQTCRGTACRSTQRSWTAGPRRPCRRGR